jgi:hypothetical protein
MGAIWGLVTIEPAPLDWKELQKAISSSFLNKCEIFENFWSPHKFKVSDQKVWWQERDKKEKIDLSPYFKSEFIGVLFRIKYVIVANFTAPSRRCVNKNTCYEFWQQDFTTFQNGKYESRKFEFFCKIYLQI